MSIRPAAAEPRARVSAGPRIRLGSVVAALTLVAISSLAALALERMGASLHADVPPGWPANGCLGASVTPLSPRMVDGQATLCVTDRGTRGTLDMAHLAPGEAYREWIAYFESPRLCSFGALEYQVYNFHSACTLSDLGGIQPHGLARVVAESAVDAQGLLHMDAPVPDLQLKPRAQAWLVVGELAWFPMLRNPNGLDQSDTTAPLARAEFDLP